MPWAAAAAVAGAVITSGAAEDAADSQAQGAARSDATQREMAAKADATQRYMYDTTRADNAPFLQRGLAASDRLAMLMGLPGATRTGNKSADQIFNELKSQYDSGSDPSMRSSFGLASGGMDVEALRAAAQRQFAAQPEPVQDAAFGSLTRKFSADDLAGDVVYNNGLQFGLDEGRKGIERQQQASGGLLSGATLKALSRYGTDYGTTKTEGAYNRYTQDNTNTYNKLAGIAGSGQTASAQVGSAGQNYANGSTAISTNLGNSLAGTAQGLGNARAASGIAVGNAISGGIQNGVSAYQGNQYLKQLQRPSSGYGYNIGSEPYDGYNASIGLG